MIDKIKLKLNFHIFLCVFYQYEHLFKSIEKEKNNKMKKRKMKKKYLKRKEKSKEKVMKK